MKFIIFFLFVACLQASARGYAQKVTLSQNDVSLKKIFKEIEKQGGYNFFYKDKLIRQAKDVSIHVTNVSVEEALNACFQNQPLSYTIVDKIIVIKAKKMSAILKPEMETITPLNIITGSVKDESGKPLAGVSVMIKGTQKGTTTNAEGNFSIDAKKEDVLEFSIVGYKKKSVTVGNSTSININMEIEATAGSEIVVVVGYGTQKKANLTGAVSQVSSEVLENRSLPNLTQGLEGVIPNLNLTMQDGKPIQSPSYNVRGTTSIGQGGNALVLIDGVEGNPSLINPNDVASVTVLKDASSAAIYGARGAFGVVLITTKSAKKGKMAVSYSSSYSLKKPTAIPDQVTDGYTYAKMFSEAYSAGSNYTQLPQNINKTQKFSQAYLDAFKDHDENPSLPKIDTNANGEYVYYANTDWYKLLYKDHNFATDQNLSVSGSSDKASFYVTGRFYNQEGIFRYNSDNYRTYNFRAKGSIQPFKWLEINNNTSYSNVLYHNPLNVGEGGAIWRNMSDEAHTSAPLLNPDGTLTYSAAYTVGDFYYGKNGIDMNTNLIRNTTGFIAKFFENKLRINGDFTFQGTNYNQTQKRVPVPYSTKPEVINYVGLNTNDLQERYDKTNYLAANLYGEYENTFGEDHHFKALLGYNFEQSVFKRIQEQRNGLIFPDAQDISLALGQSITTTGGWEQWDILGGFFRFNYRFRDKYLLEVNGRYDGSSKFPQDQQFGFFPSVSAGWRLSKENFWHVSPKAISDVKVRASYGSLGNGNINSYSFLEQLGISQSGRVLNGQRPQVTSAPGVIPNGLTWETSTTKDLGADISFLENRLAFTGDLYNRKTTNMFTVGPTLPDVFGAAVPKGNYADLKTTGWEMTLNWQDQFNAGSKPFNYGITVNAAHYKALITKYNNPNKNLSDYYVGEKLGEIWGYVTKGYWTADDVSQAAAMNKNISNNSSVWLPGDIKYADLNKDGVISHGNQTVDNPGDMVIIGNETPRYTYGFGFNADWNNFFFAAFFQGRGRTDWYPSPESDAFWGQYNRPYNALLKSQLGNIWSEDNTNAYWPRYRGYVALSGDRELSVPQTKYLQNAAYLRLKTIQFGYNLPQKLISKIKMSNASVYISGENLWVTSPMFKITKHNFDPESIDGSDRVLTSGTSGDAQNYPMLKSVTLGLNITF